jgi:hypothetical protein
MEDIYSAIIGEPTSDREKLMMIAEKLRKREMLGQLGQLTGDRVISPMGAGIVKQVSAQAEDIGRRGETARYRKYQEKQSADTLAQRAAEQAWQEKFQAGQLGLQRAQLAQAREIARLNRDALLERARLAAEAKKTPSNAELKAASTAEQKARAADRLSGWAGRLGNEMPEGSVNAKKDLTYDILATIKPAWGEAFRSKAYNADQKTWRAEADRFDQEVSNLAAGLAITGYELANKMKWSPFAPGLSPDDSVARATVLKKVFDEQAKSIRGNDPLTADVSSDVALDEEIAALEAELAAMGAGENGF